MRQNIESNKITIFIRMSNFLILILFVVEKSIYLWLVCFFLKNNSNDDDELIPWSRPGLLESQNITKKQSNIFSDIIIDSQTRTPTIDSSKKYEIINCIEISINMKYFHWSNRK